MKISRQMNKLIEEMKVRAIALVPDIPIMKSLQIEQKATKKKEFKFQIINLGKPAMKIYVNDKFYKSLIYSKGVWNED